MIIIHAHMEVQPAKEEAFLQQIQSLLAASQAEEGNLSYELLKHTGREHAYTMVEVWRDGEAVAQHNGSAHFQSFIAEAKGFLSAPLAVKAFQGSPLQA
ncbi:MULTISPECIES: putative quinol monooxygenase [Paenibacillus]|uniref:putative quinol monooxygenase n=1 Tax=Paenibacillus TaxID=44249 RepID=UPI0022B88DAF|nr:putative quinol monooxygenase [Paenibacillus caseinilyticus]MCZ8520483.1 putative quinol monooxygenase [Paenibacillus caseinilyticus]